MNSLIYVFIAYAVVWVGLFAYLYYIQRRQAELQDDLEALARRLERPEP